MSCDLVAFVVAWSDPTPARQQNLNQYTRLEYNASMQGLYNVDVDMDTVVESVEWLRSFRTLDPKVTTASPCQSQKIDLAAIFSTILSLNYIWISEGQIGLS